MVGVGLSGQVNMSKTFVFMRPYQGVVLAVSPPSICPNFEQFFQNWKAAETSNLVET